jgi:dihydrolipoamide dehydrogenase
MTHYDAVVIGAGVGGCACALKLAEYGKKVALIERAEVGGTCLNRGCIPTKALLHAASFLSAPAEAASCGVTLGGASFDRAAVLAYENRTVGELRSGMEAQLARAGVVLVRGSARVTASLTLEVTLPDGTASMLTADDLVLAVGSRPALPPIPGADCGTVFTQRRHARFAAGSETAYHHRRRRHRHGICERSAASLRRGRDGAWRR